MTHRSAETGFTPIYPNPFIVGNPVRGRTMFFGREAEFELVRRRFEHSDRGGLLVFCGERRSGKTSILFQILDGRLGPDFIPVLIDMQSMAVDNEIALLNRICDEVRAALGAGASAVAAPTFTAEASHSATFQRFIQEVLKGHPNRKLILLFDEYELFENKIDSGLLSPDVLHILASLIENHPVFIVFTGSQHLEQRRKEYWKILGKSLHKMISFLERDDALSLIRKPVEGRVRYPDETMETIWRLSAGQPFYTQAICQSLVDHLNERRTNDATREIVADVVDGIVNNPLPQMIFMWDGLERDEKLVLSLLAETIADEGSDAAAADLMRHMRRRQYPIALDHARVATTLEKLFKNEMLLRHDRGNSHRYAFRMDLWRLWIRRQHSVWQVMREEGLEIRRGVGRRLRKAAGLLLGVAVVLVVPSLVLSLLGDRRGAGARKVEPGGAMAPFLLEAEPATAMVFLDGQQMGFGPFRGQITLEKEHRFHLSAPGYADSEIVLSIAPGDPGRRHVALRELRGDLRIETVPPGAEVRVDGRAAGRAPVTVRGLSAAAHEVAARLTGFGEVRRTLGVRPDTVVLAALVLEAASADLLVTSDPSGSEVRVDGRAHGRSPVQVGDLAPGRHEFSVWRDGHLRSDTSVVVTPQTRRVHVALVLEPPGFLIVQGDRPAEIWIGGVLVVANVQNSGRRLLPPGTHQVRVVFSDGETKDHAVLVKSRARATYDYTRGTVTWSHEGP